MIALQVRGEAQQVALGARLAAVVGSKALIFLQGELGAGKTTLVRGFLQARGHRGNVKSPTYTLIEPYELPQGTCYHLDLYRLADGEELEYLGLREMLAEQAVLLVEWPQRGDGWLPPADLRVDIAHAGDSRRIRIEAESAEGREMLSRLSIRDLA
jgi:tRNA threonylcarbamoyladenosine biosynthesis protein TsaE